MCAGGRHSAQATARDEARILRLKRLRKVLWRDFSFLVLGGVALKIITYVESHASDVDLRGGATAHLAKDMPRTGTGIFDAGFAITAPLYRFLSARRDWNDALALLNSLILVAPNAYLVKVTLWDGDYTLSFRILATQLFRSFCGWFTYLPPDRDFLVSYYDFPEILQCMSRDCSYSGAAGGAERAEVLPFVSFFSGHVATVVMAANHMYLAGHVRHAVIMHMLNVLQIVRLLATRGHYSIDIIIGWCVAVYVSNPAERLGRYYSGGMTFQQLVVPGNAKDAFERVTGMYDVKVGGGGGRSGRGKGTRRTRRVRGDPYGSRRSSSYLCDYNNVDRNDDDDDGDDDDDWGPVMSDTAARILAETATDLAAASLVELRTELSRFGLRMQDLMELRRADMVRLLDLAQLRISELRAEARWFVSGTEEEEGEEMEMEGEEKDNKFGNDESSGRANRRSRRIDLMSRGEVLELIMERTKSVADRTARIAAGMAPEFAMRSAADLSAELAERAGMRLRQVQDAVQELRRGDLLRLLALAQLKVEELRAEARLLGVALTEGMNQRDILAGIMLRMRDAVLERLSRNNSPGSDDGTDAPSKEEERSIGIALIEVASEDVEESVSLTKAVVTSIKVKDA